MTIRNALQHNWVFSTSVVIINNKLQLKLKNNYNKKIKLKDNPLT